MTDKEPKLSTDKETKLWTDKANKDKEQDDIKWSFDCGQKLDFDGPLIHVSSRFYPLGNNIYDGSVTLYINDTEISRKEFSSRHIENIKDDAEKYANGLKDRLIEYFSEKEKCWIFLD